MGGDRWEKFGGEDATVNVGDGRSELPASPFFLVALGDDSLSCERFYVHVDNFSAIAKSGERAKD